MRKVYFLLILLCSSYAIQAQTYAITTCSGVNISYSNSAAYPSASYLWSAPTVMAGSATGTGSGSGAVVSQTLSTTTAGTLLSYSVTESNGSTTFQLLVTVNPVVTMNQVPDQILCYGTLTSVTFTSAFSNASFNWIKDPTPIGLTGGLTGTGNITSFSVTTNQVAQVTSVFAVTPFSNSCAGTPTSFSITVYPLPTVNVVGDQAVCNGFTITATTFTGQLSNTTYRWTTTNVAIAGGALGSTFSGTGNIPAFAGNASGVPSTALLVVTPMSNSCSGASISFSLTVNPTPVVNPVSSNVFCYGASITIPAFTGLTGSAFNWSSTTSAIGLGGLTGSGNIPTFTSVNPNPTPLTAFITVEPLSNTCVGSSIVFSITINPLAIANGMSDITACNGTVVTPVTFTSPLGGVSFGWDNNNPAIGIGAPSGTGNIAPFTSVSAILPAYDFVTVTPSYAGCPGTTTSFTITINPTPSINTIGDLTVCNAATVTLANFVGSVGGTVFSWTSTTAAIGIGSLTGAGNIAAFSATNASPGPLTAYIVVSSISNTCVGNSTTFSITVNPLATVNAMSDITACNGTIVTPVVFTGPLGGTSFGWTNNNPAVGIGSASGAGNIVSFTGTASILPEVSAVTVTPSYLSCPGTPTIFNITINPTPSVNAVLDQTVCTAGTITVANFVGSVGGSQFTWSSTSAAIGLGSLTGTGDIIPFSSTNSTIVPLTAYITVSALSNSCAGAPITFSLTVNPVASVTPMSDITSCSGVIITPGSFISGVSGTSFAWTNTDPTIGLVASGIGSINPFTATSAGIPVAGIITVTPTAYSCPGTQYSFTISVNPVPTVAGVSSQAVCSGVTLSANFTGSVPNAVYNWTSTTATIGLGTLTGTGNIANFISTNSTSVPITAFISVNASSNTCTGANTTFSFTVNPVTTVTQITPQLSCSGLPVSIGAFASAISSTTYTWTNVNPSIGLGASGAGNTISFTAAFSGTPLTSIVTVQPNAFGCNGTQMTFTISVNPTPTVNTVSDQAICKGLTVTVASFNGSIANTQFDWIATSAVIGIGTITGTGDILPFLSTNTLNIPVSANITVTPVSNTCTGTSTLFSITVYPTATVNQATNQVLCNGVLSTAITFGGPVTGTTYAWFNSNTLINLGSSGTATIPAFTPANGGAATALAALITVTPTANGCAGTQMTFTINVNPTPTVATLTDLTSCNALSVTIASFVPSVTGTVFNWTSTASIGLPTLNGTGDIAPFTVTNGGGIPITAFITVVPVSNTCIGPSTTFSVTVYPTPTVAAVSNFALCNGFTATVNSFTSGFVTNTVYNWGNFGSNIGITATSPGDITPFQAINTGTAPISANILVTPMSNACSGATSAFTITVYPTPVLTSIVTPFTSCNTLPINIAAFTSGVAGAVFNWTSTTSIGIPTSGGSGSITTFAATNSSGLPITSLITVIPVSNTCFGATTQFTITVYPTPTVAAVSNFALCNGFTATVNSFISGFVANTVYDWANFGSGIGITSTTPADITPFQAINNGTAPISANIQVTPMSNSCSGATSAFTITVYPTPVLTSVITPFTTSCNTLPITIAPFTSGVAGAVFNWTSTTSIGIPTSGGSGSITTFAATNSSGLPITSLITVIPVSNTCFGATTQFTITVYPTPTVAAVSNFALCNGFTATVNSFISGFVANTVYDWANFGSGIGITSTTPADITPFQAINNGTAPISANIQVTPMSNACSGATSAFTITVYPTPVLTSIVTPLTSCNTLPINIASFTSGVAGAVFNWTSTTSIGIPTSGGAGSITTFAATNSSGLPITSLITVIPVSNTCFGATTQFTITVYPTPTVAVVSNFAICNGFTATVNSFISGFVANTVYDWANFGSGIGITSTTPADITPFQAINTGTAPISANILVTPMSNACSGATSAFTITVYPTPVLTSVITPFTSSCNTLPITIAPFTSGVAGAVFNWTSTTSIGIPTSGGSGSIATFAATNSSGVPVTSLITVIPVSNTCFGATTQFTITVYPTPTVAAVSNQSICNGFTATVNSFISGFVANTVYDWANFGSGIGITSTTPADITPFQAINNGTAPISASIVVIPMSNACTGAASAFTITVNPTPVLTSVVTPFTSCNTLPISIASFTSGVAGAVFNWTSTTSVGIPTSGGSGSIATFAATNSSGVPVTSLITVIPVSNTCFGATTQFTITVYPTPTVAAVSNQSICNGFTATVNSFISGFVANTVYDWANFGSGIGITSTTPADITPFQAINTGTAPISASIVVIPMSNACTGAASAFTITVNPTPVLTSVVTPFTSCNTLPITIAPFTSGVAGAVFNWTSTTSVGIPTAGGAGSIATFAATNSSGLPITSLITVIPVSNTCFGATTQFTITVYPTPTVAAVSNQSICNGFTATVNSFISGFVANTVYNWGNFGSNIGITSTTPADITPFQAINSGTVPISANIRVIPMSNACTGAQSAFTITVNPTPILTSVITPFTSCNTLPISIASFTSGVAGTVFNWTSTTSVGIPTSAGAGSIATFAATNSGGVPVTSLITVIPISNTCLGATTQFTITVYPTPTVAAVSNQSICNGFTATVNSFISGFVANTVYNWGNFGSNIGITSTSPADITPFQAINNSTVPISANIRVIPMSNACTGAQSAFTITVNPTPVLTSVITPFTSCNTLPITIAPFTSGVAGTVFNWTSTTSVGIPTTAGAGSIATFAAANSSGVPVTSLITVIPISNTCLGATTQFTVTVYPTPTVATVSDLAFCNGFTATVAAFTNGPVANTVYNWTNSNSSIGLTSASPGNIAPFISTNATAFPVSATIFVIPMSNACNGATVSFTITINPTPQLSSTLTPSPICSGTFFSYTATSATPGTGFSWNRSAIPAINANSTGSGVSIINEQLFSIGTSAVVVPYAYILTANGCTNAQSITVAVNPTPDMNSTLVPTAICSGTIFTYTASSSSPGATFTWIRILPSALSSGGAVSAATTSIAQSIANSTTAPAIASYAFTVSASGCTNPTAFTVTFDVNPTPVLSSTTTPTNICSGTAFAYAATSATVGTAFGWSRTVVTGITTTSGVTGTGNSIFNVLNNSNPTLTPETYNITMTANNCTNSQPVVVNIYPVPVLNTSLTPAPVCSNAIFNYTPGSATGTVFNWTRAFTTGITNTSASGSGNPAETLISTNPLPVSVIYTYSVITAAGCNNAQTITATINPLPTLSSSLTPPAICTGVTFSYPPTSNTPGTVFNWTRPFVSGVTNASSTGFNNPSETLSNPTITPVAVVYNYTLTANGCATTQPVTVVVNPIPVVGAQSTAICSNSIFTITPTNVPVTTLYTWAAPVVTPLGSTLGSNAQPTGITPISQFLNNQTVNATTVVYTVVPTATGCSGNTFTITVTVNPTPVVGTQTMTATCSGTPFNFVSGGVPTGTNYTWSAPALVPANGLTGGSAQPLSQPAVSQTLNSTNNVMDSAVYSVTPATLLCVGTPFLLTVPVKPLPLLSNMRDTICSGNAFVLNPSPVPANTTYTWAAPVVTPGGSITGGSAQTIPTAGITQTLTNNSTAYAQAAYTITPSALNCAGPSFLLIETVNRSIPVFTPQAALICSGTAFNANPSNAPAGTLYTWPVPVNTPPVGITGSSAVSVPVLSVSQLLSNLNNAVDTVIYTVTPLVNNCPGVAFNATIRVLPLPKATISGPTSVCANTIVDTVSIAFNGTGPWSFTYSDGITTNTKTGVAGTPYKLTMPPIAKNLTKRTITVMNVKDASCSNTVDSSFFTQTINPLPVGKVISLHGNYLCNGIKDTLFIQSPDSLGYQWQLNGTNIAGAITDSIATTTGAGSYNAVLTNKFGCIDTAAVPVNLMLVKPPVLKMTIDTTCINSVTTFTNKTDTAFTGAIQWQWTFGNGLTASTMNATTTYTAAGNYHVILKATQLSCSGYPPVTLDSTVNIKFPIPALANSATSAIKGELTPVAGRSIPGYKYQWVPSAGIQNPDSPSTIFNFGATQQYVIKLISPEGCITNDSLLVRVFDENTQQIFVPKSFTPNGDGVNDIMYPYIAGIKQFHYFRILNRFGKLLFETKTENAGWNGMLNGTPQPMGIYFWFAEGIGADGTVVQKSGQLLLIR